MLTEYEKRVLKQAIGLVISYGFSPRDVAKWFSDRVDPGDWTLESLVLLFQRARNGADLPAMERFLDINRCSTSRRGRLQGAWIKVDIPFEE